MEDWIKLAEKLPIQTHPTIKMMLNTRLELATINLQAEKNGRAFMSSKNRIACFGSNLTEGGLGWAESKDFINSWPWTVA